MKAATVPPTAKPAMHDRIIHMMSGTEIMHLLYYFFNIM